MEGSRLPFRQVMFGVGRSFEVRIVSRRPMRVDDCGMYIHVADIDAYREWVNEAHADDEGLVKSIDVEREAQT